MKFKNTKAFLVAGLLLLAMGTWTTLFAQGDDSRALIDVLAKKGLLTNQEAADVAAKINENATKDSGYRIKVGSWIQELRISGDARLRYEYREGQTARLTSPTAINPSPMAINQTSYGDTEALERWRWRLRLAAEAKFTDDFTGGLGVEPSANDRSGNVTFGGNPSGVGAAGGGSAGTPGPFGKGSNGINLSLIYLEWHPTEWVTLTGGRMRNPLMTSLMVWDPDLTPEGARETFKYDVNDKLQLFATLGQFMYDDKAVDNPIASPTALNGGADAWLFAEQFGLKYSFNKDTNIKLAPVLYTYSGPGDSYLARFDGTSPNAANPYADVAINDLRVVEVPLEFNWTMWQQKFKLFGDVAVNTAGAARADHAGRPDKENQNLAYMAGVTWGEAKHKGNWEVSAWWQHTELYALDPNLVDSDIFDYRENLQGIVFDIKYCFTENVFGEIRYARADRVDNTLPTTATSDFNIQTIDPITKYQLLQVDLNWKF